MSKPQTHPRSPRLRARRPATAPIPKRPASSKRRQRVPTGESVRRRVPFSGLGSVVRVVGWKAGGSATDRRSLEPLSGDGWCHFTSCAHTFIGFLVGPSCPAHRFATPWVVDTDIGTGRIQEENPIRTASMFGSTSCVFCLQYITDQAITSWVGRGICCSLHKAFLKLQKKACSALERVTSWS